MKKLAFVLFASCLAASSARGGELPPFYQVSAYNGYSVTITCFSEYGYNCELSLVQARLLIEEAQRICGKGRTAELAGSFRQYGLLDSLFLCLAD